MCLSGYYLCMHNDRVMSSVDEHTIIINDVTDHVHEVLSCF